MSGKDGHGHGARRGEQNSICRDWKLFFPASFPPSLLPSPPQLQNTLAPDKGQSRPVTNADGPILPLSLPPSLVVANFPMQNLKSVEISTPSPANPNTLPSLPPSLSNLSHSVRVKDDDFLFCIPNDCHRTGGRTGGRRARGQQVRETGPRSGQAAAGKGGPAGCVGKNELTFFRNAPCPGSFLRSLPHPTHLPIKTFRARLLVNGTCGNEARFDSSSDGTVFKRSIFKTAIQQVFF